LTRRSGRSPQKRATDSTRSTENTRRSTGDGGPSATGSIKLLYVKYLAVPMAINTAQSNQNQLEDQVHSS